MDCYISLLILRTLAHVPLSLVLEESMEKELCTMFVYYVGPFGYTMSRPAKACKALQLGSRHGLILERSELLVESLRASSWGIKAVGRSFVEAMPIVPSSTSTISTTTTKPPSYSIPVTRPTLAHGDHNRVKHSGVPTRNNHSPTNAFIFLLFLRILRSLQSHITHLARINLPRKEEPYPLLALLVLLHQLGMVLPFYLLQPVHLMLVMHLQGASSPSYGGSPKPKLLPFPPISLPPPTSPSYGVSPIPKLPPSPQLSPHHLLLGLNLLSPLPPPLRLLVLHASIQSIDPILIIGHHCLHHHHQQILKLLLATLHCYPTKICHHHHCLHHHHQQILKLLLDTLHHHPTKIHHLPLVQLHYPLPPSSYVKPSPRFRPPPQPPSIPKMPPNHHQTSHHIPPLFHCHFTNLYHQMSQTLI